MATTKVKSPKVIATAHGVENLQVPATFNIFDLPESINQGLADYRTSRAAAQRNVEEAEHQLHQHVSSLRQVTEGLGAGIAGVTGININELFQERVLAAATTFDMLGGVKTYFNIDENIQRQRSVSGFIGTRNGTASFGCQTDGIREVFAAFFQNRSFGSVKPTITPGFELPRLFMFGRFIYMGDNRYFRLHEKNRLTEEVIANALAAQHMYDQKYTSGKQAASLCMSQEWGAVTDSMKLAIMANQIDLL